jgi:hypothetical protein
VADLVMGFAMRWTSVSGLRLNDTATAENSGRQEQGRIVTQPSALVNRRLTKN